MGTQAVSPAVVNVNLTVVNDDQCLAVNELLRLGVVLLDPLQCQDESAPYAQDPDVVRKLDVVIVDDSTNDTSQDVVLNLLARR